MEQAISQNMRDALSQLQIPLWSQDIAAEKEVNIEQYRELATRLVDIEDVGKACKTALAYLIAESNSSRGALWLRSYGGEGWTLRACDQPVSSGLSVSTDLGYEATIAKLNYELLGDELELRLSPDCAFITGSLNDLGIDIPGLGNQQMMAFVSSWEGKPMCMISVLRADDTEPNPFPHTKIQSALDLGCLFASRLDELVGNESTHPPDCTAA